MDVLGNVYSFNCFKVIDLEFEILFNFFKVFGFEINEG